MGDYDRFINVRPRRRISLEEFDALCAQYAGRTIDPEDIKVGSRILFSDSSGAVLLGVDSVERHADGSMTVQAFAYEIEEGEETP